MNLVGKKVILRAFVYGEKLVRIHNLNSKGEFPPNKKYICLLKRVALISKICSVWNDFKLLYRHIIINSVQKLGDKLWKNY